MLKDYFDEEKQCFMPVIDVDVVIKANERLKLENDKLKIILSSKVLIVEDGSVDIDKLEEDGFYVINYRQGSRPPMWLTHQHEDKGE
jgi:hypothetical protein